MNEGVNERGLVMMMMICPWSELSLFDMVVGGVVSDWAIVVPALTLSGISADKINIWSGLKFTCFLH